MKFFKKQQPLLISFLIFFLLNLFLYLFISHFHNAVPFQKESYIRNYHHYLEDPRVNDGSFNFLRSFAQGDAQWYLKIADAGYPYHPVNTSMKDKTIMDGLTYAFFPLYPLLIKSFNGVLQNIEQAAFVLTFILLIVNFFSLHYIVSRLFSQKLAVRTIFLLFLFPFSIFYRSFFAENLLLFLILWFSYFLIKKQFLYSSIFLALMNVTKGNVLLLNVVFLFFLIQDVRRGKTNLNTAVISIIISLLPFVLWCIYNYFQTGNFIYFYTIQTEWLSKGISSLFYNIETFLYFPFLPFHTFHYSKIEVLTVLITLLVLIKSKRFLPPQLWWISLLLWLTPLLSKDLMSFTRLQIISFPLFLYLASIIKQEKTYITLLALFTIGLMVVSIFFVNSYWIG